MATVTVPVDELKKQIDILLSQGALLHFIKTVNIYEAADCAEDVLQTLIEKAYAQNNEVHRWLDKLSGGTLFS